MGEETWAVAVADDPEERAQGLMGVADLGGLRGMLFVFPGDGQAGFWMKGTILALDVAFFTGEGGLVEVLPMAPCAADPCPVYRPRAPYRYALEVPRGGFTEIDDLRLDPGSVPAGG